jgi:hypothetical protein
VRQTHEPTILQQEREDVALLSQCQRRNEQRPRPNR